LQRLIMEPPEHILVDRWDVGKAAVKASSVANRHVFECGRRERHASVAVAVWIANHAVGRAFHTIP